MPLFGNTFPVVCNFMKNAVQIALLLISNLIFSQQISLNKTYIRDSNPTFKTVAIQLKFENLKLDSLNSVELSGNAEAILSDSNKYFSDDFYTDKYFENKENNYDIVFDSLNKNLNFIKCIKGKLKYISLSESNNSIVKILIKNEESLIFEDSKTGIKIFMFDAKNLDDIYKKKRVLKAYLKNVSSKNSLDKEIFSDAIMSFLKDRYQFKIPQNLSEDKVFYVENPSYKVINLEIYDTNNIKFSEISSEYHSEKWTTWEKRYFDGKKIPKNFFVKILLENPESIKYIDFELKNIELK